MTTLREKMASLPAGRRKKVEARAAELIAQEMTLRDLRKALELTQEQLARTLNVNQASVSTMEKRTDVLLSTLRSYVEAMGGELDIVARFPNRQPIVIRGFEHLEIG
ncbi:MAG: XRE family transcriptional regulator [Beijerinckiaceae bacterium]